MYSPEINPSILSADFRAPAAQLATLAAAGARVIHVDVMDGHFVPNLTFGPLLLRSLNRDNPPLQWDVHLMVDRPAEVVEWFQLERVKAITIHAEASPHVHRLLAAIRESGRNAGVCLNPSTPISAIPHVLECVEQVLIMTVNPGFGGQSFIASMVEKVAALAEERARRKLAFHIQVDGGIDLETIPTVVAAGADRLVVGHGLFSAPDPATRFKELLAKAEAAYRADR